MNVSLSLRVASGLLWISTIGLGIPCVMAIRNLYQDRGIPYVLGFPAYGGGGFERRCSFQPDNPYIDKLEESFLKRDVECSSFSVH